MTILEAAVIVLTEAKEPLHLKEIARRIEAGEMVPSKGRALLGSVRTRLPEHVRTIPAADRIVESLGGGMYTVV